MRSTPTKRGGKPWTSPSLKQELAGILETFDTFLDAIMMPLMGVFVALFVGWITRKEIYSEELNFSSPRLFSIWRFLIRFVCPPALLYTLYLGIWGAHVSG